MSMLPGIVEIFTVISLALRRSNQTGAEPI